MDEGYNDLCFECSTISAQNKQTMFGRTKNVIAFSNVFYQTLVSSGGCYASCSEDQIAETAFEELVELDSQTSIGEAFWSLVSLTWRILLSVDCETREVVYWILHTPRGGVTNTTGVREERTRATLARSI